MNQSLTPAAKRRRPGPSGPPLSDVEQAIHDLIISKGNEGILLRSIKFESKLPESVINKALKTLVNKSMIKEVKSIKHTGRKVYMGAKCTPSKEVSGGVWYENGKLDTELVGIIQEFCSKHFGERKADTLEGVHRALEDAKILNIKIPVEEIAQLLKLMVLEDKLREVKSNGLGDYYGIPVGKMCYRTGVGRSFTGVFASIPCGMCPRIALCTPDGVISPATCVYYNKWLDIELKKKSEA